MTVSNHRVAASDGSTDNPAQVEGGTFIDGGSTSASGAISNRLSLGLTTIPGNGPTENVHGVKSRSGGTWDYQVAGSYVVRRMATTINGTADDTLKSGGSMTIRRSIHVRSDQIGAKLVSAHRAGQWRPTGMGSASRHNWTVKPTSAAANYAANTGSASATSDAAARPTRAIPGELVYLHNHVDWTDNMIDYAARG
tara:strand:+ start:21136 stop:21723 length:588 start_codon:yes stop_codon:yes gene_type:complete